MNFFKLAFAAVVITAVLVAVDAEQSDADAAEWYAASPPCSHARSCENTSPSFDPIRPTPGARRFISKGRKLALEQKHEEALKALGSSLKLVPAHSEA